MTDEPLRGVLIGCGFFADNHLHAWSDLPGARIVAVCDLDAEKARRAADRFGIPASYTDAATMFEAERPDFVDIVTTSPSHRPLVELAARQGVPAICQKPFADTLEDARAMVAAAEAAGVPLMVHENFRWQRPFREMAAILDAGTLGAPQFARFSFRHGHDVYANQPYLAEVERLAIMDVGLHVYDLVRRFMGEAEHLFVRTQRLNPAVRGEDAFNATIRHTSGAVSTCDVSFFSKRQPEPFPETVAEIECSGGTMDLVQGYRLVVHGPDGRKDRDVEAEAPAWATMPWHVVQESVRATQAEWIDALRSGREPRPSGADNLRTLILTLASYDSAARDAAVTITGDGWR